MEKSAASLLTQERFSADSMRVAQRAAVLLDEFSLDAAQRCLFQEIMDTVDLAGRARAGQSTPAIHLPLHVCAALHGDRNHTLDLAVVLLLLETGVYVLDHIMDGELSGTLTTRPGPVVLAGAISFLSYLPRLALGRLRVEAALKDKLLDLMDRGLARMSHGQGLDLGFSAEAPPSPADVERAIAGKTGARRALYVEMAAVLAGAQEERVRHLAAFAASLGVARQIDSDIADMFLADVSRDLRAGICTLPLALYFATADAQDTRSMQSLLARARHAADAVPEIRAILKSTRTLGKTLVRKEMYCHFARQALQRTGLDAGATGHFQAWLDEISLASAARREASPEPAAGAVA